MSNFPITFDTSLRPIDQLTDDSLLVLRDKGYKVQAGITTEYLTKLLPLVNQPSIREYCPKDLTNRFGDEQMSQKWLAKGRAMFWLLPLNGQEVAGYGWAGPESCPFIPAGQTTFAIRINEHYQGQGLAAPFSAAIIAAAREYNQADNFWLETWQSNAGAVHIYQKLGFKLVAEQTAERPTVSGTNVTDTRLYMQL